MVILDTKKAEGWLKLGIGLVLLLWLNMLANHFFFRMDLTEEKRFTIKEPTKKLLAELEDVVYIEVFLEGALNPGFKRMRKSIAETLEEFSIYSNNKVQYTFTDPTRAVSERGRNEYYSNLARKGVTPTTVFENVNGSRQQKLIFPGAVITYGSKESGVMLLKGNSQGTAQEKINQSIELLEFELANKIDLLVHTDKKRIGYVVGHGEPDSIEIAAFTNLLLEKYLVNKLDLDGKKRIEGYEALVIAKPVRSFSEQEKYKLDQFIMNGGKVAFFLDAMDANMDSIGMDTNLSIPYELGLDDLLFKYGIRLNKELVQDQNAAPHPVVTGMSGGQPQINLLPWPYYPLINNFGSHTAVKNLDAIMLKFVCSMDTVAVGGILKTPILLTSNYSRTVPSPANVSMNMLRKELTPEKFNRQHIPVGYFLEGAFTSLYKNRFLPEGIRDENRREEGVDTKIVVVADGDLVKNAVNPKTGQPYQLGYDPYAQMAYGNEDLMMNLFSYLLDDEGIIVSRTKEVKIRPLDKVKIVEERLFWQVLNMVLPLLVLGLFGVLKYQLRKRKFVVKK